MTDNDDVDILEKIRNIIDKRYEYSDGSMWDFEVIEDAFKRLDDAVIDLARLQQERDEYKMLYEQTERQRIAISKEAFDAFGNNGLALSWKEQVDELKAKLAAALEATR